MSAKVSVSQVIALPPHQSIAQELAYRMVQVNANSQKILDLFTNDAVFIFTPDTVMDKKQFAARLQTNIENTKALGKWKDTFQASTNESNEVIWKTDGFQQYVDKGLNETGEGWYHLAETIHLKFAVEDGKHKISEFRLADSTKTKLPETEVIRPLPESQKIIHKLAFKSFQIPQQTESMIKLYDQFAEVLYPDGRRMGMSTFAEMMRKSNTLNVLKMGEWSNTYSPVESREKEVQWIAEGFQMRLGLGKDEDGEGWYKIRQLAKFIFTDISGKEKILEQNNLECSKAKEA